MFLFTQEELFLPIRIIPSCQLFSFSFERCPIFLPFLANAQLNEGGVPPSFSLSNQLTIPVTRMPGIDKESLLLEDQNEDKGIGPFRFGYTFEANISMKNAGTWTELDNGDRIWQMGINCSKALAVQLLYKDFHLPKGAKLFIYSHNREEVLGAFTARNNKNDGYFATGLVKGSSVVIEYFEPASVKGKGSLTVEKVIHVYRTQEAQSNARGFGSSANCQNNVNCAIGSGWESQRDAVVRILIGGGYCTGTLINNSAQDNKLYLLTAHHCLGNLDAESNPNGNQVMFNWNYEGSGCDNPGSEPTVLTTTGATLKANFESSDFALFELTESPLANNNIQSFFAGWNRNSATTAGVSKGIHHPMGDIKKISIDNDALVTNAASFPIGNTTYPTGSFWEVIWNTGVTEGGSSGSAIFDANRRVIGQLLGGSSFCTSPNESDVYGKISASWEGGGSATRRLKDWLDPANSGMMTLDGKTANGGGTAPTANFTANTTSICLGETTTISFSDASTESPTSWAWTFEGGSPSTSTAQNPTVTYSAAGTYDVQLVATNAGGSNTSSKTDFITVTSAPCGPVCETFASTDIDKTISAETATTITSTLNIPLNAVITDVNLVNLTGTHTWLSDLSFSLASPGGTNVQIINQKCAEAEDGIENFNINLDDSATNGIPCEYNNGETYIPDVLLAAFNGENAMGNWILSVTDNVDEDGGSLTSWGLEICYNNTGSCQDIVTVENTIAAGTYKAATTINATGTVANAATVLFQAGTAINLNAPFTVPSGATFTAQIANCTNAVTNQTEEIIAPALIRSAIDNQVYIAPLELHIAPNPSQYATTISYKVPATESVSLQIVNTLGQSIAQLENGITKSPGIYRVNYQFENQQNGIYFAVLTIGKQQITKRMLLLK